MEIVIVILFLSYIGYREWVISRHFKDLELMISAKTPQEYATLKSAERIPKATKKAEEDEMVDPFDVNAEDALKGIGGKRG